MVEEKKYTVVLTGGLGKHIIATTLLRYIQEQEPGAKITVISGYPEVFLNNPRVYKNLHHMTSYVYDDYIKGSDFRLGEPYSFKEYYEHERHIAQIYPIAYRFTGYNENTQPELYINDSELREAQYLMQKSLRPTITLQVTGGNQRIGQMKDPAELTGRDLLTEAGQQIVKIADNAGFNVIQVALPHEVKVDGAMHLGDLPFRKYINLIPYIKGHIGIDSAMMHAVAAFKKPALIFWGNSNVKNLGYDYIDSCWRNVHRDACPDPMCGRPHVGIPDLVPEGAWRCPYARKCQHWTPEEIEKHVTGFLNALKEETVKIPLDAPPTKPCSGICVSP